MTPDEFINRVFSFSGVLSDPTVRKYGDEISSHLRAGIDMVWSPDTHQVSLLPQEIQLFEEARVNQWKAPIGVDAGYRTRAHELALEAKGYKTAKFVSPHSVGCALDCRVLPGTSEGIHVEQNSLLRRAFQEAATALGFPQPRIGHRAYNEVFCHVDLMFMLFAPYTSLSHPSEWPELAEDQRLHLKNSLVPGLEW